MKKLIAAIAAAVMMSFGLVATTTSSASAAPCQYPQTCFETQTNAVGLRANGRRVAKIFVGVTSFGNGRPTGVVGFTFVNPRTGKSTYFQRRYPSANGRSKVFTFAPLRAGKYKVIVTFAPEDDSQYLGSSTTTKVKVKGGKKRRR